MARRTQAQARQVLLWRRSWPLPRSADPPALLQSGLCAPPAPGARGRPDAVPAGARCREAGAAEFAEQAACVQCAEARATSAASATSATNAASAVNATETADATNATNAASAANATETATSTTNAEGAAKAATTATANATATTTPEASTQPAKAGAAKAAADGSGGRQAAAPAAREPDDAAGGAAAVRPEHGEGDLHQQPGRERAGEPEPGVLPADGGERREDGAAAPDDRHEQIHRRECVLLYGADGAGVLHASEVVLFVFPHPLDPTISCARRQNQNTRITSHEQRRISNPGRDDAGIIKD